MNAGMSRGKDGITYVAIFPNPRSGSIPLDFNIEIIPGDSNSVLNGKCSYINGKYSGGSEGCTVAVSKGFASIRIF